MDCLSRRLGKIVVFVVGNTIDCTKELYYVTRRVAENIERIYTEGSIERVKDILNVTIC